jgi:hypothetical protein
MDRRFTRITYLLAALSFGCNDQTGDYSAASSISEKGFARDVVEMQRVHGQEIKIWGLVDYSNLYGNHDAKTILGDWWSGDGPSPTTWRFNLKAGQGDEAGDSFPVLVPNDQGRDELLGVFVANARAEKPTKVYVKGKVFTFDAPTNVRDFTGLYIELQSSQDIRLGLPEEN